ncbi:MAG: hypothetical protein IT548_05690 [Alphaproteobacteria bacterium]|nr:hypothetical protein [Alphaproteobacteria bacterium]
MAPTEGPDTVIEGRDGFLFLRAGVLPVDAILAFAPGEDSIANFAANNHGRRQWAAGHGTPLLDVVAPNKHAALKTHFPFETVSLAALYRERDAGVFAYPRSVLADPALHFRTDSHWTPAGQIAVARVLAERLDLPLAWIDAAARDAASCMRSGADFAGDLGRRFQPPSMEPRQAFKPGWTVRRHNNGVGMVDGLCIVQASTRPEAKGRLLIFGDSLMMTSLPCLSAFFREIVFCRSRNFHPEIAAQVKPDWVICEVVERYLGDVPADSTAPLFLDIPKRLGVTASPSPEDAEAVAALLAPGSDAYRRFVASIPGYAPA